MVSHTPSGNPAGDHAFGVTKSYGTRSCSAPASVLSGLEQETQTQVTAAVESANRWLEEQTEARRDLFSRLNEAVNSQRTRQVRRLLAHVNAAASRDRTEAENAIVDAAAGHLAPPARGRQAGAVAGRAVANGSAAGHERVRNILVNLRRRERRCDDGRDAQSGEGPHPGGGRRR
ncbi:hypothetical protein ACFRAO_37570 [Streptomyces sp. NPDC056656]|uniref:hypothetical protein n=1 Tax=Streptomyces sp. NPDC056656 TaxID=3345895 RepID=UPI0036B0E3BC